MNVPAVKNFSAFDCIHPPMLRVKRLQFPDIVYVAQNMRPRDREEIYLGSGYANPVALASHLYKTALFGGVILDMYDVPQSVISFHPVIPGVWSVGAFATDSWEKVFTTTSIYAKKIVKRAVTSGLVRRVEVRSLSTYRESHTWLEWLGAKFECELKDWGLGGETYYQYAWKLSDFTTGKL